MTGSEANEEFSHVDFYLEKYDIANMICYWSVVMKNSFGDFSFHSDKNELYFYCIFNPILCKNVLTC